MSALVDILKGERGFIGILLIIGATVLGVMDRLTFDQWSEYTMAIFAIFVAGKTVTTSAGLIASRPAALEKPGTTINMGDTGGAA